MSVCVYLHLYLSHLTSSPPTCMNYTYLLIIHVIKFNVNVVNIQCALNSHANIVRNDCVFFVLFGHPHSNMLLTRINVAIDVLSVTYFIET